MNFFPYCLIFFLFSIQYSGYACLPIANESFYLEEELLDGFFKQDIEDFIENETETETETEMEIEQENLEEFYDFPNYQSEDAFISPLDKIFTHSIKLEPHKPEYYLLKAIKSYENFQYENCIHYIHEYEDSFMRNQRVPSPNHIAIGLSYKAYAYKHLKRYESAKNRFKDLIEIMRKGTFTRECLFYTCFEHASCYAALGKNKECFARLKALVNKNLSPTLTDLENRNYTINKQPCFHYTETIQKEKIIIDLVKAQAIGQNILSLKENEELIPKCMTCSDESLEFCKNACLRVGGVATIAAAFIPNKVAQALVLYTIVEFDIECEKCCEHGFGSENCLKKIKWALTEIGNDLINKDSI